MARILPNLILLLALVACQAAGAPGADSSDPARPKVDRVVMLVEPPAREGNEGRHQSAPDNWQLKPIYEYLAGMDSQVGKIVPELATEWSIEPTGLAIRFKLRKGVQFHQGKGEFTAKDLVPPGRRSSRMTPWPGPLPSGASSSRTSKWSMTMRPSIT